MRLPSFEVRMMLPALIPLALLSFLPLAYIIWMSLSRVSLIGGIHLRYIGTANWTRMFSDSQVVSSWRIAAIYFAATLAVEMVFGIAIAILFNELVFARSTVLSLFLMPMFVAPVIVGLLGRFLTDPTFGLYSWVLGRLGISTNLLGHPTTALMTVIFFDVWEWTPLIALICLAGLTSVSRDQLEAAMVDGASYVQRLRHIVLPNIAGIILIALLIRAMDAIRFFDIIWIMTNGGPADSTKVIALRLYEIAFRFFDLGYAAAIGLGMLVVTIIVANIFVAVLKRRGGTS